MKYILILVLLSGCINSKKFDEIDKAVKDLKVSTKQLNQAIRSLECVQLIDNAKFKKYAKDCYKHPTELEQQGCFVGKLNYVCGYEKDE